MSIQMNTGFTGTMMPPPPPSASQAMSSEQKSTVESILEQYDSASLSEADATSIVAAISDAGIMPGEALQETMAAVGFDAKTIGDLAGVGEGAGAPPPPPQKSSSSSELNQSNLELLESILEEYDDIVSLSSEQQQSLSQTLLDAGLLEPGALIDTIT